jgi:hypothetical protein
MPGELGYEEEQQGAGYYERRCTPDDSANMPVEPMESMREKVKDNTLLKVLQKHIKDKEG